MLIGPVVLSALTIQNIAFKVTHFQAEISERIIDATNKIPTIL